jgi:hypothetical protein
MRQLGKKNCFDDSKPMNRHNLLLKFADKQAQRITTNDR